MGSMRIQDTVAVVTGACGTVGRALAMELAKREAHGLALVDGNSEVKSLAAEVNRMAGDWVSQGFWGDLTDAGFRTRVFEQTGERCGSVNVLVPASANGDGPSSSGGAERSRIVPVYWALEMVARIAARRERSGLKSWNPGEPPQGMVFFIRPLSLRVHDGFGPSPACRQEWERAAIALMTRAEFHGVRCAVMLPGEAESGLARAAGLGTGRGPGTLAGPQPNVEAIAKAICFMIADYTESLVTSPPRNN